MDPYETHNPQQYKPSFLQKRLDRLPLGPVFSNSWEPKSTLHTYPQRPSGEQELQFDDGESHAGPPVAESVAANYTYLDLFLSTGRTVLDIKHDNRARRYELGRHSQRKVWRKSLDHNSVS